MPAPALSTVWWGARALACVAVIAAIWLIVFGRAAGVGWSVPLRPAQRQILHASDFHVVMGAGVEDGTALRIGAVGESGSALQSITLGPLRAADYATLRYHFSGYPRTLELSLVFRRADAPADVQVATVPWPGDGWRSVDLRRIPGWHGEITELGFAEYATPQVAPETRAFEPFRFDRAELWSPSWRGGLDALRTSWFGYTPWALISVSALGPQREAAQAPALMPLLVLCVAMSMVAVALLLRRSWRWTLCRAAWSALVLWVLLDLRWMHEFHAKHLLTEQVYAAQPWAQRQQLVSDQGTAFAAGQVAYWLASQPQPQRVLVASDLKYTVLRLIYLLLPQNVALLQEAAPGPLPPGSLILLYASTQWHYDAAREAVIGDGTTYPVEPVFDSSGAYLYRLRGDAP